MSSKGLDSVLHCEIGNCINFMNYHKTGSLRHQEFILLWFWKPKLGRQGRAVLPSSTLRPKAADHPPGLFPLWLAEATPCGCHSLQSPPISSHCFLLIKNVTCFLVSCKSTHHWILDLLGKPILFSLKTLTLIKFTNSFCQILSRN